MTVLNGNLRGSILKEIRILEAGIQSNLMQTTLPSPGHTTMCSFFTQTHKNRPTARYKLEQNDLHTVMHESMLSPRGGRPGNTWGI